MPKFDHEVRDPIHRFIQVRTDERRVLDSRPVQRLRHIHQLALSYLVYPGSTQSMLLEHVPPASTECVYIAPELQRAAVKWYRQNQDRLLKRATSESREQ